MKTKLNQARWLAMAACLLAGVHVANAWYSPSQQRWINRDPLEEGAGANLYAFAENNPPNRFDPFGLFADGYSGQCPTNKPKGHSDFYGHNCFDFTAEDHGPTRPVPIFGKPGNHFQDIGKSLGEARAAIAACDPRAFERAMHRVQDCFSHAPYSWEPPYCYGHVLDSVRGKDPDSSNVAWEKANRLTRRLVDEYIRKCGLPNDHIPIEGTESE